jgi:hypothetical protein
MFGFVLPLLLPTILAPHKFLCSCRRQNIDALRGMLIFAADDDVVRALAPLGVATFRHPALGSFPTKAAHGYGDVRSVFFSGILLYRFCVRSFSSFSWRIISFVHSYILMRQFFTHEILRDFCCP